MTKAEQRKRVQQFIANWTERGYEKGESQKFWLELLEILGVKSPFSFISFEEQIHLDHTSFIDGVIPSTHVLIEQKSFGKNLRSPIKQSDGSWLTPFQQAKRYASELPYSKRPRWIVTSNFAEFLIFDMEQPNGEPTSILLKDLERELYRLNFLVSTQDAILQKEMEISLKAGYLVGKLYNALLAQYINASAPSTLHSLNALCVRLVFCLYAEDAGLFGSHTAFHDYLASFHPDNVRTGLIALFKMLDTPISDRDPYERKELLAFPYVNGGLFADEQIEIPRFTPEILHIILQDCSADFDWSGISPTIFGAVFESTLNPETRRSGGMHYTSIKNIHKVIDPLFLNDLTESIGLIEKISQPKKRNAALHAFQNRLASLRFLDPACGSGNFLTETFLSLRRLENRVLKLLRGSDRQVQLGGDFSPIKVSISQFYGIEVNDFAATVAKTALWIAESQMMKETEDIVGRDLDFLPLKTYTNIIEGNALRLDWQSVISKDSLHYIMGNPPFIGASMMTAVQKEEAVNIYGKIKLSNSIDYVGAWYHKAAQFMQGTSIRAALVSTNSITQGEQVAPLWRTVAKRYGIHIDFAYRTFRWDSEASLKAHVHCVIIGFSCAPTTIPLYIYDGEMRIEVQHINAYLLDAPDVWIESRAHPLCNVPQMYLGNKPTDGGNLILSSEERNDLLRREPALECWIRPYIGSVEYINNKTRYCFWLKGASPADIRGSKELLHRVRAVREMRLQSTSKATREKADVPHLFFYISQPNTDYLLVPSTSSENRKYIPIGFLPPNVIVNNAATIVPNATLYHFGVLTSSVHMAWMRVVCGRLKSDYRYSNSIVYNNFPWPNIETATFSSPQGKVAPCGKNNGDETSPLLRRIEQTAQGILDARALYPDASLADLYDEALMPPELRKAHQENDRAVMQAYGFLSPTPIGIHGGRQTPIKHFTESDCVAALMRMYQELVSHNN